MLTLALLACHTFLTQGPEEVYTKSIGYLGLAIEAVLPLPQMLSNQQARSCRGFRFSVLVNWLIGDAMKMAFFFVSAPGKIPVAFRMCAFFQAACDVGLGVQYYLFGNAEAPPPRLSLREKELHPELGKL